jgi:hypothetical protein
MPAVNAALADFASAPVHAGDADGTQDDGQGSFGTQKSGFEVHLAYAGKDSLLKGDFRQVAHVASKGLLAVRTALRVIEQKTR